MVYFIKTSIYKKTHPKLLEVNLENINNKHKEDDRIKTNRKKEQKTHGPNFTPLHNLIDKL